MVEVELVEVVVYVVVEVDWVVLVELEVVVELVEVEVEVVVEVDWVVLVEVVPPAAVVKLNAVGYAPQVLLPRGSIALTLQKYSIPASNSLAAGIV